MVWHFVCHPVFTTSSYITIVPYRTTAGVLFVVSCRTAVLSHRMPASAGTWRGSCYSQGRDESDNLQCRRKLQNEVRIHEAVQNFDLPACNTTAFLHVITWYELISLLKTHIRHGYKTVSLQGQGGQMNDINSMAISYRRAIKTKMTEWHSKENKTVTIAPFYCKIKPERGLEAISSHH